MPYRPSPGPATRMVVACRMARRRAWSSRAVVSVAGHGVPYGPVRAGWHVAGSCAVGPVVGLCIVPSRLAPATSVSRPCSWSGEPNARCLPCPGPTMPVADAATGGVRTCILLSAVALHECPFGGAAKARRWAALTPTCGCRTVRAVGEIAHHHVSLGIIGHHRISLSNRT